MKKENKLLIIILFLSLLLSFLIYPTPREQSKRLEHSQITYKELAPKINFFISLPKLSDLFPKK